MNATERDAPPEWAQDRPPGQLLNAPSEKQLNLIRSLLEEKDLSKLDESQQAWAHGILNPEEYHSRMPSTKQAAGRIIEALLKLPRKPRAAAPAGTADSVPEGRYAIEEEGVVKFYRLSRPTEGRWAGYTFLSVQASDDLYPIRNATTREAILLKIAQDPQAAMLRYGTEIGSCGHCGRTLTNEESREYGIGPVCRAKMGW